MHNSYSRIDFFLLDSKLLSKVLNTKYYNIIRSDHAPVSICLDFKKKKQQTTWRFRPHLINDSGFCKYLSGKVDKFLDTNDTLDTSDLNWESGKVVMRGHVISYKASLKKTRNTRLQEIDIKLSQLEAQYKQSNNSQTLQEIINLKYIYNNTILTKQVSDQLSRLRSRYFELGDKPHTLLARQLRGQQNSRVIYGIRSGNGDLLTHPELINK